MLDSRLLTELRHMLRAWCNFFTAVLLFLVHFFVVRDIAWIGHA